MPSPIPTARFNAALQALGAGALPQAHALLDELLREAPGFAPAWAALGQLAAQRRDWAASTQAFERALALDPGPPRVWFAQAQVLDMLQRPRDALHAYAQAADRQPGWSAPRYQVARLLRAFGQGADALGVAAHAVRLAPVDADALQLLAMLQEEGGTLVDALATLERALALAPERASLHHNLGVVLHRLGRHDAALAAHEQAQALGLDAAEAHFNRGNTLQAVGRIDAALAAYRQALAREPLHALSLTELAKLRWLAGDADFDAELRVAEASSPQSDLPPGVLGQLLLRAERVEAALAAFDRAARLAPQQPTHADGQGQALSQLGRHSEAHAAHHRAVTLAPQDVGLLTSASRSLYAGGHADEALALAARAHALQPEDQLAIALLGLGWRLKGDPRDAWLHDMSRVVGVIDLAPPPGFADIASFNAALAQELAPLHVARQAPIDQTLRHGTQTRDKLFDRELPLVQALRRQIEQAIDAWLSGRPEDPAHPLLGRRRKGWRFTDSWSSRLRRSGFHTNHIHGHGWLSSCYYVSTPLSALNSTTQAGWIQFGEPDLPEPLRARLPPLRYEAPVPGRLLLFPSYFWHGTRPFDDDAERLTVAFDLVPD